MSASEVEIDFVAHVEKQMELLGTVQSRRMFGGYGIFLNGKMFALIADSELYLKADKENEKDFLEKGLGKFSYVKKDKIFKMSYFYAPEEVLEDADEMYVWASKAYSAALRASVNK